MNRFILSSLVLMSTLWSLSADAQKSWVVSPRGSDRADGTPQRPFQTIDRALEEAARYPQVTKHILLRGGQYTITQSIEVTGIHNLTIAAYRDEPVSVTGSYQVSPRQLRPVRDAAVRERLQESVRDHILEIDTRALGIPLSGITAKGFGRASLPGWSELFIDGTPLTIARWPNDSMVPIGKVHCTGDIPRENKSGIGDPVFEYAGDRPSRWQSTDGMWIGGYFAHGYADDMIPVRSIDTTSRTITAAMPTLYGFMSGAPWREWYALNLVEEIDLPGEYVLDSLHGKIYLLPPTDHTPKEIYISTLESPLFQFAECRNVTLRGITLEYSRGMGVYIEQSDSVRVDSCTIRNLGYVGVCIGRGDLGSNQEDAGSTETPEGVPALIGTLQNRTYNDVLFNRMAGSGNGVSNCYIYQVGAGGVSLSGGDRKTLTPAGNYVENCRIHTFNRLEKSYRPGIWIEGVGNRISNCEIYDAPSMAILLHGNNHTVEYCDIHHVCREVDDQGAFYYGRDPSEQGNRVQYCYFHDFSSAHRVSATYHDDGACGLEVFGCVYFRAGTIPVLIGGGHDNIYRNNLFLDLPMAIHIDNRMEGWGRSMLDKGGIVDRRLQTVRHTEAPYATAYPRLAEYWEGTPRVPRGNEIAGNLFWQVDKILNGATSWADWSNNWVTTADPGLVDAEHPLKGFVPDAAIYRMIDHFTPIPFERIGCKLPPTE